MSRTTEAIINIIISGLSIICLIPMFICLLKERKLMKKLIGKNKEKKGEEHGEQ